MRKLVIIITAALIALLSGCSQADGKVGIIKGPGSANSSMLISFNELCSGSTEGFLGSGSELLVSEKSDDVYRFYAVNTESGDKKRVFSAGVGSDYSIEISSDGKLFLCNSYLINMEDGSSKYLPERKANTLAPPSGLSMLRSYSIMDDGEVLLTDPDHYIKKFNITSSMQEVPSSGIIHASFMPLGDKSSGSTPGFSGFSNINPPKLSYLMSPKLLLKDLKYIFIGCRPDSGETPLYVFDLYEKKFNLLDDNVKGYALSPDGRKVTYIKTAASGVSTCKLIVSDLDGGHKKELLSLPYIAGIEWSRSSGWVAYSGGEKAKCDVGIVRADGSLNEQLTNGMHSAAKLAWSASGEKLAFTSSAEKSGSQPSVYIITLNNTEISQAVTPADPVKERLSSQLRELMRRETAAILKSGKF